MKITTVLAAALLLAASAARAQDGTSSSVKIKPKASSASHARASSGGLQPATEVIDAPTTGVLDNYGYSARSRFYANGGVLQYLSFGVYPGINLGASAAVDGLIGDERHVRMRAPTAQVKWRFYEGDNELPSFAVGFDGQGYRYNSGTRRFNQRQRGFYVVATKELGAPGLEIHPSFNVSDFDTNGVFGSLPLSINIRDKATILVEWDNINNWSDSRLNLGLRAHLTSNFNVDFALRAIGAGGHYSDGVRRGPERIVQLKYSSAF
ncbi:MAG: hypothetical protein M0D55_20240 [Elusimicrobiota bacterium]|nr:MAG: hypothetical protein M0D55_20240 [Elusimicrobiota bacterium]